MDQNSGIPVTDATNATDSGADFNINIHDQLGVPPAPPIPDFLANDPITPGVNPDVMADLTNNGPTPIVEEPVNNVGATVNVANVGENAAPVATAMESVVVAGENGSNSQFEEVKKQMLQDLYPLMDKIKMQPEQKFKVYKQMIETTGSKEMITSAYEAVKEIDSEEVRAEALLFLVEKADS